MTVSLHVTNRTTGSTALKSLRAEGKLPGVVYGPKQEPISVTLEKREFEKVFKETGESTIISLEGLEKPIEVLVHDVAFAPSKDGIIHVDFYAIERGKEMTTVVPLTFSGEAPAEKVGGVVNKVLHEVEITCKPSNLPHHIDVDLNGLAAIDDRIVIADLVAPEGVTIENDPTEVVVIVGEAEEGGDDDGTAVDMSAIEVEHKGKEDTEGDAAAS